MVDTPSVEGFTILEELGSGTLSSVYKAVDEGLHRAVALKILRAPIAPSSHFAAHLEREARILAELSHPNVGQLLSFVKSDTSVYLVLEFVDGFSLATLIGKMPVVSPRSAAAIGAEVARGLAHCHARGIVHRDIKPANVLVSRAGEVKIFDFGIAHRIDAGVDAKKARLDETPAFGTPAYMSPEQILGENVDARSDIFSLGIVLYQLLCGAGPFERGDDVDRKPAAQRIRRDPPVPLHRRAPDVPVTLERIVMRAIEKLPGDRFQSARALADPLEDFAIARSGRRSERLIVEALEQAGLVARASPATGGIRSSRIRNSVRGGVSGLAALALVAATLGVIIQTRADHAGEMAGARPMELLPSQAGYVRVLATPWAEVWVDGQRVDVTPFARTLPMAPGTHYLSFVHPKAPVERRTISVAPGETRIVDVTMSVRAATPEELDAGKPPMEKPK